MKNLYIHKYLILGISIIVVLFLLSYWLEVLFPIAWILVVILLVVVLFDLYILYSKKNGIDAERDTPIKFSNSDKNDIFVTIKNKYNFPVRCNIIEELPVQFQKRDFDYSISIKPFQQYKFHYSLRPMDRGEYHFGKLHIFTSSPFRIITRRYSFYKEDTMIKTYPSYIQMKKYSFLVLNDKLTEYGVKKIRRIGHTMEFEQIKKYVTGDDIRSINWKATAKHAKLMVNQYQDEKSQPIYSIIDTGRVMKMPFEGLKLLDYAINSALAFSNIAILKNDKAGILDFGKKVNNFLQASKLKTQMLKINEALYNIDTDFKDSDFGFLTSYIKHKIPHRSLLIIYTNFEHKSSLKRQLRYIKSLSKKHPIVVVIFENTELEELTTSRADNIQDIYHQTIGKKFFYDKKLIIKELQQRGIHTILTKPQNLTVNVINKYFELKARGRI